MSISPRNRKSSYNFMNDDIDNDIDIEIQFVPMETNETFVIKKQPSSVESLQENIYYLQQTPDLYTSPPPPLEYPIFYDSLSNSPLSLSSNTSLRECDQRECDQRECDQNQREIDHNTIEENSITSELCKNRITYKKLTFEEIEHSIQKNYKNEKLASQLDILITFIKGQKHLYTQSYHITKQKINALVFPSILISGSMMVLAPIIQNISWSGYLLSGINALLTIFTSILNFWNLHMHLNQYNTGATHFDRLETSLIMTRNNVFLVDNVTEKNERILAKIVETETRMMEMKEENGILIPREIQLQAPIISHLDIFSFIHQMESQMKTLLVSYKDVKNEIRYIMYKWKTRTRDYEELPVVSSDNPNPSFVFDHVEHGPTEYDTNIHSLAHSENNTYYRSFINFNSPIQDPSTRKEHERNRLQILLNKKDALKQRILDQYKKYAMIDRIFSDEIQHAENISYFFSWGRKRNREMEPILREFMTNYGG